MRIAYYQNPDGSIFYLRLVDDNYEALSGESVTDVSDFPDYRKLYTIEYLRAYQTRRCREIIENWINGKYGTVDVLAIIFDIFNQSQKNAIHMNLQAGYDEFIRCRDEINNATTKEEILGVMPILT